VATPVRLLAILVLADLAGYFIHRAMHTFPVLWRFHRVHHAAFDLTWWETWRQHPVDALLHALAVAIPGALLGSTATGGFSLVLLRILYTSFIHADIRVNLGPAEGLIATPAFHRIHHSHDPRYRNCNYSTTLALIDWIFGTATSPLPPEGGKGTSGAASRREAAGCTAERRPALVATLMPPAPRCVRARFRRSVSAPG